MCAHNVVIVHHDAVGLQPLQRELHVVVDAAALHRARRLESRAVRRARGRLARGLRGISRRGALRWPLQPVQHADLPVQRDVAPLVHGLEARQTLGRRHHGSAVEHGPVSLPAARDRAGLVVQHAARRRKLRKQRADRPVMIIKRSSVLSPDEQLRTWIRWRFAPGVTERLCSFPSFSEPSTIVAIGAANLKSISHTHGHAAKSSDEPASSSAGCRIIHCNAVIMFAQWSEDGSESWKCGANAGKR